MDNKKVNFIINTIYIALIVGIVYFIFAYGFSYVMPFVIGFGLAALFQPLIRWLHKVTKIPYKLISIVVILSFFGIIIGFIGWGSYRIVFFVSDFFKVLPDLYDTTILPYLENLASTISQFVSGLDPSIVNAYEEFIGTLISSTTTIISSGSLAVVTYVSGYAAKVPMLMVSTLIMIIVTFFISVDFDQIVRFLKNQLTPSVRATVSGIGGSLGSILKLYGKSYLLIITITFVELSIGLSIIGISNSVTIAFLIAIFDVLPVLGTGGIMIPWAIFLFIDGNITLGISILVVYVVVTVIRNIIEPRIIGHQVGLHPVITLLAMYVGVRLLGFIGLFVAPITLAILKSFHDAGKITLYKETAPIEKPPIEKTSVIEK
jgi:sporulation integral membrane protein YtvI